ncbi:MAG: ABC transporter ATP-binding protein [Candidatus Jettenia sp.]|uniref:ABC transporter ATP-binding component n=1 Tax=Candidatus Jettenia caeni TaxID=247490 RepID=I3IJZ8_9BACT|nr:ABC-F family ATP-binding cassette domain-containing protein [Candidatus Jettenia sp. AMX1]MBC6929024.1 ABC transporter ATP-binding protein [Candidatus Jettenia sp.]NUN22516.1 ABC-F family ATP-binding cassette domain-containing protein [Candidatus Jettenia caeni]KAA0249251.1 MAG: ABC transporter ATP-binding protein [Candidatus Jettenia sp. AMX1]MCE7881129.1 ABC transporter ATP-binding protein [Candidatus Jettenia sp. AMX1]MCQ3927203.1 ABC transporter ATP-binding protein [Candidatus Jettenia 
MIRLNTVNLVFGSKVILDTVSLHIQRNDRIGLIGPNGTGKSTLFKIVCRCIEPSAGTIIFAKNTSIGYLPQEGFVFKKKTIFEEASSAFEDILSLKNQINKIHTQLEDSSLQDEDRQALLDHYVHLQHQLEVVNGAKVNAETGKVLKGMGFKEADFERSINTFSGGWQMRVALSKLLLQEPNLLLLDEPTNHLDIDSILWLEEYLKEFKGGLIIISHDRAFLDRNVSKIWELEKGDISEYYGNYSFYEAEKEKRKELQIARYTNQQKRIKEVERFIERFRAKNTKASQVQSRIHMLEKMEREELPEDTVEQVKFRFRTSKQSGVTVLDVKDVSHIYDGRFIFQDICFSIERGEKVALVGQNGSGKSTLSRIIAGIEQPYSGTIKMGHNVLSEYFAQEHAEKLNNNNTLLQEIESVAPFSMIPHVRHILGAFLFSGDDVFKTVNVLSGGEKSRLSLAKMLLKSANFLILDEPTNHIDITTKKILKDALLDYTGSVLIVSHDRDFLDGLVSKVYELRNGKIHIHLGSFKDFLEKKASALHMEIAETEMRDTSSSKSEDCGSQKQQYLQKKEQNARKRKLTKEVQTVEEHIALLEVQKKEFDHVFSDVTLYNDKERSVEINKQYKVLTEELNSLYKRWEIAHTELESLHNKYII